MPCCILAQEQLGTCLSLRFSSPFLFVFLYPMSLLPSSIAAVDPTVYPYHAVPELPLRQVLHSADVPAEIRVKIAAAGVKDLDVYCNLAEKADDFVSAVKGIIGGDDPLGSASVAVVVRAKLISSWKKALSVQESNASARRRLQEDPLRIPEIPIQQYNEYRAAFVEKHPDFMMLEYREPHQRFIERLTRDLIVHEVVPCYHIGEIRLRSEKIVQRSGFSRSADLMLQVSTTDEPATVCSETDAVNRITAFFIALEYVGVLAFDKKRVTNGTTTGGALDYLTLLERKRRETPGLQFVILADETFRKRVYTLCSEEKKEFPTYAAAMAHVLKEDRNIWPECRLEVVNGPCSRPSGLLP